ncbi:nuclease-related domain-containing protein [Alkalibacterium sp. 20]|uniref:nuclease-related domain-containing protein n=1 Tax=Alkalibacterium sp. 20 TaxID=1798803 RepID=UPI0009001A5E|nr:nuclease-related domain-containing protein [Alkalibacterium sp. 20]OJF91774.1 hypothetical protein AX762_10710 [Alkalibacterium sp. 20]
MIVKERERALQLESLVALSKRGVLLNPQENYINQLVKGFEGECAFDALMKGLKCECLILNDLLLKLNGHTFKIDTLMISSKGVSIYEVKNFEGEFVFREDKLKIVSTNKEITNPVHQLNRKTMLFRQLMEEHRVDFPLKSYIVFVNKQFTLFETPVNQDFILPTMISRHLKRLNNERGAINISHTKFSDALKALHHKDTTFITLSEYSYTALKKESFCKECSAVLERLNGRMCECMKCGHKELAVDTIFRQINEFRLLFPDNKLTTNEMYQWSGKLFSKKSIRSVLSKHFTLKGQSIASYYE